jgi:thiamine-phosphate pyrophosphorylase
MIICLVTDRRRLAPGAPPAVSRERLVLQARSAVAAGIDLLQIRERDLDGGELAALVSAVLAATRGTRTRVVVNDRLDVALACGADGVHLRADSIAIAEARRIAPEGFLVGRSLHEPADVSANADADYLVAGTVFRSASKSADRLLLGAAGLRAVVAAAPAVPQRRQTAGFAPGPLPVLAIGGVDDDRVEEIAATGAAGIAAIGLFATTDSAALKHLVARVRLRFDSVRSAP